jgi:hypothetical protein
MEDTNVAPVSDSGAGETTPEVESTPTDQTDGEATQTSEKTETTEGSDEVSKKDSESPMIPKWRFDEVNSKAKELARYKEIFENIQNDPKARDAFMATLPKHIAEENPTLTRAQETLDKMGYIKRDNVVSLVQEILSRDRVMREIDQQAEKLAKEWDGKEGKPKFDMQEVAEYMNRTGILDPESAFEQLHRDTLADYRVRRKMGTPYTEKPGTPIRQSSNNRAAKLEEAKKTGNWKDLLLDVLPYNHQ